MKRVVMPKRFLSLCSGIEAASVAWAPIGWQAVAFAEIEAFPSAVLAHHYPDVPNLGDMTKFKEWPDLGTIDLICGGTPCQSFSVAGLRKGLADPRGNLSLTFLAIVDHHRPRYVVWENVPGVLSASSYDAPHPCPPPPPVDLGCDGAEVDTEDEFDSEEIHAFHAFLAGLSELGYGVSYRVLDAQYVRVDGLRRAVPQRRRRVFVVGYLGDWRRAAAVLSEPESVLGNTPPRREAGAGVASGALAGTSPGGGWRIGPDEAAANHIVAEIAATLPSGGNSTGGDRQPGTSAETAASMLVASRDVASTLTRGAESSGKGGYAGRRQEDDINLVAHSLRPEGYDASEDGTGRGTPIVPIAFNPKAGGNSTIGKSYLTDGSSYTLDTDCTSVAVAFAQNSRDEVRLLQGDGQIVGALAAEPGMKQQTFIAQPAVAFTCSEQANSFAWERDVYPTLSAQIPNDTSNIQQGIRQGWAVRRLTPTECERLQGFPDGYTAIPYRGKPAADGPRYKALGNSWSVNVARWVGRRIEMVEQIAAESAEAAE